MINTLTRTSHGWSSSDHQGVSSALWPCDVAAAFDVAAACRQGQTYAAGPQITLPVSAMQAILTAEHIAKLDRQLGAPQPPACDATSNVSSSSHVNDLLSSKRAVSTSPQPGAAQQPVRHQTRARLVSAEPARASRGRRSPAARAGGESRRPGGARKPKPAAGTPAPAGRGLDGLDALAACAALLCGDVEPPQAVQHAHAAPGHATMQGEDATSEDGSPSRKRSAERASPTPDAIRPVARLPDWAFVAAAQAAAAAAAEAAAVQQSACRHPVPPLWKAPEAVDPVPQTPAGAPAQHPFRVIAPRDEWAPSSPSALEQNHHHHHPTVMLFGTNLRLVAAKPPSPPLSAASSAAAAQATVLQSLEEKIKELNEMRRRSGLPDLSTAEALAPSESSALSAMQAAASTPHADLAAAAPVAALPQPAPATPQAKVEPPPALHRESSDSISTEPAPPPAKRTRRAASGSVPPQPQPAKALPATPALPSKQAHEQSCAKCGRTETPTWRRAGKQIYCNACGLKHHRSLLALNRREQNA